MPTEFKLLSKYSSSDVVHLKKKPTKTIFLKSDSTFLNVIFWHQIHSSSTRCLQ